jgi:hypothetical protein
MYCLFLASLEESVTKSIAFIYEPFLGIGTQGSNFQVLGSCLCLSIKIHVSRFAYL